MKELTKRISFVLALAMVICMLPLGAAQLGIDDSAMAYADPTTETVLTASTDKDTYFLDETVSIAAILKDVGGNALVGKPVELRIGTTTYASLNNYLTNDQGIITFNISASALSAGNVSAVATFAGDSEFSYSTTTFAFTVSKRTVTITTIAAVSRPYDGTTHVDLTGAAISGVLPNDEVTLNDGTGSVSPDAVGDLPVELSGFSLAGVDSGKYTLSPVYPSITATITKATYSGVTTAATEIQYGRVGTYDFSAMNKGLGAEIS